MGEKAALKSENDSLRERLREIGEIVNRWCYIDARDEICLERVLRLAKGENYEST